MRRLTKHLTPALAALAVLAPAGIASAAPDLKAFFPDHDAFAGSDNWFVDTSAPGSVHYYFYSQVQNVGADPFTIVPSGASSTPQGDGTRTMAAGQVGGSPTLTGVKLVGTPNGNLWNWGIDGVASFTMTPPGRAAIPSALAPVCREDSFNLTDPNALPPATSTCNNLDQNAGTFSATISPGWADSVDAVSTGSAYFDVTGVAPGVAQVAEVVDPTNSILESDETADNTATTTAKIPGVTAGALSASTTAGKAVAVALSGQAVFPEIKGRTTPGGPLANAVGQPIAYAVTQPGHGSVTVSGGTATYTPGAGYSGPDSFSYTARDVRGLVSSPATVSVTVAAAPGGGGTPPPVVKKITLKLKPGYVIQRRGGKTYLRIKGKLPKSQAGRIVIVQRKVGKKVRTLATIRIARNGVFTKLVRVSGRTITVRTRIAASSKAKAAVSPFKRVVIVRSKKR
jgi:hypothetical protein